ncbi:MAG TPA: class I SAM-dependent methyltransferase [Streptosporangiaceae bacterium]|nr:class I SAM-dependent methyltransferase [Streptosporangiaceae bacterium]
MTPAATTAIGEAAAEAFDAALAGVDCRLQLDDGRSLPLPVRRWHGDAGSADGWLLARCRGATIDLGCGPGRLVRALVAEGRPALGVDASPRATRHCAARGAPAVRRNVFDALPGQGNWQHAILADGNIGIGGDPAALLRRATALLRRGGSVLVETEPAACGLWSGRARLQAGAHTGPWFRWAVVGRDALPELARRASLRIHDHGDSRRRCFAELVRHHVHQPMHRP